MLALSATDVSIRIARERGTLRVEQSWSERFQDWYWAICDEHGLLEVALTEDEAQKRVS